MPAQDGHSACPKCVAKKRQELNAEIDKREEEFKTADPIQRIRIGMKLHDLEKIADDENLGLGNTMFEIVECGIETEIDENGASKFWISYRSECYTCKFSYSYKYEEDVP